MKPIVLRALLDDWNGKVEALSKVETNSSQIIADFKEKHGYQESTVGPGAVIRSPKLANFKDTLYLEGKIRAKRIRINLEIEDNQSVVERLSDNLGLDGIDGFSDFEKAVETELESTISLYKRGENEAMRERIPNWGKYGV